ncbi:uncharacterized protein LOC124807729 [Hydra vulgaris]|uniref:uncharacterized protein LOC124807729 n=1 Tax=Hydra vulgaris TaxID=6087 RepID=UPI001F5FB3A9|nr:uncharacterized protein LOC124807729 [Hydra vulgaris]
MSCEANDVLSILDVDCFQSDEINILMEDFKTELIINEDNFDISTFDEEIFLLPEFEELDIKKKSSELMRCEKCKKHYNTKKYYDNHILKCVEIHSTKSFSKGKASSKNILNDDVQIKLSENFSVYFWESINEAFKDEFFNMSDKDFVTSGNISVMVASKLLFHKNEIEKSVEHFNRLLSIDMFAILNTSSNTPCFRNSICQMVNKMRLSANLKTEWNTILKLINIEVIEIHIDMLRVYVINKIYEKCLLWRNSELFVTDEKMLELKLSLKEEKVLMYVSGYIIFFLLKKYKRNKSPSSLIICSVINSWQLSSNISDEVLLNSTRSWIDRVDRGALMHVNDEFYLFICHIENIARSILNRNLLVNYNGQDLRDVLMSNFQKNAQLDLSWSSLTRNLENLELSQLLKLTILKKWISMRARSFLTAWINVVKHINKGDISSQGEPGLRKTLFVKRKFPSDK